MKELHKRIKMARIQRGLTQAQLAAKSDLTANFICLIESGKKNPSLRTLVRLAEVLDVSPSRFIDNDLEAELSSLVRRYDVEDIYRRLRRMAEDKGETESK